MPISKSSSRLFIYSLLAVFCLGLFVVWRFLEKQAAVPHPLARTLVSFSGNFKQTPLYNALKAGGLNDAEVARIISIMEKNLNLRSLQENDYYDLCLSTSGVFHHLTIIHGLKQYSAAVVGNKRRFISKVSDIPVNAAQQSAGGKISGSLWESMERKGIPPQIIMTFADIFAWNIDFLTETQERDSFAVIWQENRTPLGALVGMKILAAEYDGKGTGHETAVLFENNYYSKEGKSLQNFFLRAPLQYRRISSTFSKRRFHPILRIFRAHNGIDYAAPSGTPVSSVADGVVTFAGWRGGYGKFVEVRHGNNYVTGYGHLSRIAEIAGAGRHVKQGQIIGYVGMTGLATGPHLDFSIKESGKYVNFLKLKFRSAVSLSGSKRQVFLSSSKNLSLRLEAVSR